LKTVDLIFFFFQIWTFLSHPNDFMDLSTNNKNKLILRDLFEDNNIQPYINNIFNYHMDVIT